MNRSERRFQAERLSLETFNTLNQPNYDLPNANISDTNPVTAIRQCWRTGRAVSHVAYRIRNNAPETPPTTPNQPPTPNS